jgi:hypothetical protein
MACERSIDECPTKTMTDDEWMQELYRIRHSRSGRIAARLIARLFLSFTGRNHDGMLDLIIRTILEWIRDILLDLVGRPVERFVADWTRSKFRRQRDPSRPKAKRARKRRERR